jgi:flagellar motor switch/type III secretory pathway protein FliN
MPKMHRHEEAPLNGLMRTISVPVGGEILNSLTLGDLLKISKGDILELDERVGNPIYLCVGGIAMFKGQIVQRGGKRAFEISERFFD